MESHTDNLHNNPIAVIIERIGFWTNYVTERICGLLIAAMIGVVWFGIFDRYFLALGGTWTEELARYIMIWAALLAIPCCTYRREHIGLDLVFKKFPERHQMKIRLFLDILGICFFSFLLYYGGMMTKAGATQYATIFGMNMVVPYLSVPVASALTITQIFVTMVRDSFGITPIFMEQA